MEKTIFFEGFKKGFLIVTLLLCFLVPVSFALDPQHDDVDMIAPHAEDICIECHLPQAPVGFGLVVEPTADNLCLSCHVGQTFTPYHSEDPRQDTSLAHCRICHLTMVVEPQPDDHLYGECGVCHLEPDWQPPDDGTTPSDPNDGYTLFGTICFACHNGANSYVISHDHNPWDEMPRAHCIICHPDIDVEPSPDDHLYGDCAVCHEIKNGDNSKIIESEACLVCHPEETEEKEKYKDARYHHDERGKSDEEFCILCHPEPAPKGPGPMWNHRDDHVDVEGPVVCEPGKDDANGEGCTVSGCHWHEDDGPFALYCKGTQPCSDCHLPHQNPPDGGSVIKKCDDPEGLGCEDCHTTPEPGTEISDSCDREQNCLSCHPREKPHTHGPLPCVFANDDPDNEFCTTSGCHWKEGDGGDYALECDPTRDCGECHKDKFAPDKDNVKKKCNNPNADCTSCHTTPKPGTQMDDECDENRDCRDCHHLDIDLPDGNNGGGNDGGNGGGGDDGDNGGKDKKDGDKKPCGKEDENCLKSYCHGGDEPPEKEFKLYTRPKPLTPSGGEPLPETNRCLSCHDGPVIFDTFGGFGK